MFAGFREPQKQQKCGLFVCTRKPPKCVFSRAFGGLQKSKTMSLFLFPKRTFIYHLFDKTWHMADMLNCTRLRQPCFDTSSPMIVVALSASSLGANQQRRRDSSCAARTARQTEAEQTAGFHLSRTQHDIHIYIYTIYIYILYTVLAASAAKPAWASGHGPSVALHVSLWPAHTHQRCMRASAITSTACCLHLTHVRAPSTSVASMVH